MTNEQTTCPTEMELDAHVADRDSSPTVAAHVQSCDVCTERAKSIEENIAFERRLHSTGVGGDAPIHSRDLPLIEGYQIEAEIGRGSQGVVYRAMHLATSRTVALKVLLRGAFATGQQRQRFEREVSLLAGLEHSNVVTIHDSGVTDDGSLYCAMQFVDGEDLTTFLQHHELDLDDILQLFLCVCEGVEHAHRHGVIHRDLKPQNMLVDQDGRPHVVDFGLARQDAQATSLVTADEHFVGTIAYAAPEQLGGGPHHPDVRADVYSLGVVLYEMLGRSRPFDDAPDLPSLMDAVRAGNPAPPSQCGNAREGVGADLDAIVLRALCCDAEDRYQSAAALREDVECFQRGAPVQARREQKWYMVRKTLRQYRTAALVGAFVLVALIAITASMSVMYRRANTEANKLRMINLFLEDTLGSVDAPWPGERVSVMGFLLEAEHWVALTLKDEPEVEASIRQTLANSFRAVGDYANAREQIEMSLERRLELHGSVHPDVASSLQMRGLIRWAEGDGEGAMDDLKLALDIREQTIGRDTVQTSINIATLGVIAMSGGLMEEADIYLKDALEIRRALLGETHTDVAMCLFNLGVLESKRGDWDDALQYHDEALAMREVVLTPVHPDMARSYEARGVALRMLNRFGEAVQAFEACLKTRREMLGSNHWLIPATQNLLAEAMVQTGDEQDLDEALRQIQLGITTWRNKQGEHGDLLVRMLVTRATVYLAMDDHERAWQDARAARSIVNDGDPSEKAMDPLVRTVEDQLEAAGVGTTRQP